MWSFHLLPHLCKPYANHIFLSFLPHPSVIASSNLHTLFKISFTVNSCCSHPSNSYFAAYNYPSLNDSPDGSAEECL